MDNGAMYGTIPWTGMEAGQVNVPTVYEEGQFKDKLGVYFDREKERLDQYKQFLVEKGMTEQDARAYIYRFAFVPYEAPSEVNDKIAEDWMRRMHSFKKGVWDEKGVLPPDDRRAQRASDAQYNKERSLGPNEEQLAGRIAAQPKRKKSLVRKMLEAVGIRKKWSEAENSAKNSKEEMLVRRFMKNGMSKEEAKQTVSNIGRKRSIHDLRDRASKRG